MSLVPLLFHVELLHLVLQRRVAIVAGIEQLLNCQKQTADYQQDMALQTRLLKDCFFVRSGIGSEQAALHDQLQRAHWSSGFKPRENPGNDIIDAAALLVRGLHCWRQTRWPGQKGRLRYAHTLFNVYVLRSLTLLTLRLWDNEDDERHAASKRLALLQSVMDALWHTSPPEQPVLVRDVRWLIPVAMSPTTDDLNGYFDIAQKIAQSFTDSDQVEAQKANVQTGAGHLRSQFRHLSMQKGVPADTHSVVLVTRISNALDISLLMEGLVTLLAAYQRAIEHNNSTQRLSLAAAICQGLSPDPELFVNRLDLLGPYTMIEHLFIAVDAQGRAHYTTTGKRHMQLLQDYRRLITNSLQHLYVDSQLNRPQAGRYSPYGALYGFSSNLLELQAMKTLQLDIELRFSMEDIFAPGDADKLAWVKEWRNLPHIKPELVQHFDYPQQFAHDIHTRIEKALQQPGTSADANTSIKCGRLLVIQTQSADAEQAQVAALPLRYIDSSDAQLVAAQKATAKDEQDLLYCRLEGEYLLTYQTANGWVGISKDLLTDVVGAGHQAKLEGLPPHAVKELQLMCPSLVHVV